MFSFVPNQFVFNLVHMVYFQEESLAIDTEQAPKGTDPNTWHSTSQTFRYICHKLNGLCVCVLGGGGVGGVKPPRYDITPKEMGSCIKTFVILINEYMEKRFRFVDVGF